MKKKVTKNKQLYNKAAPFFNQYKHAKTRKAYLKNFKKFLRYCTSQKGITTLDEIKGNKELVQSYTDSLRERGLSASTVHTYIAPVCKYCGIGMQEIKKDKRITAEYTRGRSCEDKIKRSDKDMLNPKYSRSVEFQRHVGIRREELEKLRGKDFRYDEKLGFWYVFVRKGKGGKEQKQRIFPEEKDFIEGYFKGVPPDEKIFSARELQNKINYHGMRAERAKKAYRYYLNRLQSDSGYREELEKQIWKRMHDKKGFRATRETYEKFKNDVTGTYKIRGENKKLALKYGLPTEYDKLALMAVSVFHLSHWRNDVTVHSYLLAY